MMNKHLLFLFAADLCIACGLDVGIDEEDRLRDGTAPTEVHREAYPHRELRADPVYKAAVEDIFPLQVPGGCTSRVIIETVTEACDCLAVPLLVNLIGLNDGAVEEDLHEHLSQLCQTAWNTVDTSTWQDVDEIFTDDFMEDFAQGKTYMNRTCAVLVMW